MKKSKAEAYRRPMPPFVEPAFYFDELTTTEAFFLVVDALIGMGGSVDEEAILGCEGSPDRTADLASASVDPVRVAGRERLQELAENSGRAIVGATISGLTGPPAGRDLMVRTLPIPEFAVGMNHHPIAVWADGTAFEPGVQAGNRARASSSVTDLFLELVRRCAPSYGAILVSWPYPAHLTLRPIRCQTILSTPTFQRNIWEKLK